MHSKRIYPLGQTQVSSEWLLKRQNQPRNSSSPSQRPCRLFSTGACSCIFSSHRYLGMGFLVLLRLNFLLSAFLLLSCSPGKKEHAEPTQAGLFTDALGSFLCCLLPLAVYEHCSRILTFPSSVLSVGV